MTNANLKGPLFCLLLLSIALSTSSCQSNQSKRPKVRLLYDAFEVRERPRTFQYESISVYSGEDGREKEGADLIHITRSTNQVLRYAGLELASDKDQPFTATFRVTGKAREVGGTFVKHDRSLADITVGEEVTGTVALELPDGRKFSKSFAGEKVQVQVYTGRQRAFDEYRDFAPAVAEHVGRAYGIEPLLSMLSGKVPNDGEESRQPVHLRIDITKEDVEKLRAVAAAALGNIRDARAVDPLIQILNDPEWTHQSRGFYLREAAIISLGQIRDPRAIPTLIEVLKKDKGNTFWDHAVVALGRMKDPRAVGLLITAFEKSYHENMRKEMAEILKEFTGQDFGIWGDASEKWRQWWIKNKGEYPSL